MNIYEIPHTEYLTLTMRIEALSMCCESQINPSLLIHMSKRRAKAVESPEELFICWKCGIFIDFCKCSDEES